MYIVLSRDLKTAIVNMPQSLPMALHCFEKVVYNTTLPSQWIFFRIILLNLLPTNQYWLVAWFLKMLGVNSYQGLFTNYVSSNGGGADPSPLCQPKSAFQTPLHQPMSEFVHPPLLLTLQFCQHILYPLSLNEIKF